MNNKANSLWLQLESNLKDGYNSMKICESIKGEYELAKKVESRICYCNKERL